MYYYLEHNKSLKHTKFLGQVAFIGGGWPARRSVEVYSPNGDCQHLLAPLPMQMESLIMFRYSDSVIACAGY